MSADREDQLREGVADMDKDRREMEEQLGEVESGISEAKETASERQDAPEKAPPMEEWDDGGGGDQPEEAVGPDGEPIVEAAGDDATIGQVTEDFEGDESAEQEAREAKGSAEDDDSDDEDETKGSSEKDDSDSDEKSDDDDEKSDDSDGDVDVATPET